MTFLSFLPYSLCFPFLFFRLLRKINVDSESKQTIKGFFFFFFDCSAGKCCSITADFPRLKCSELSIMWNDEVLDKSFSISTRATSFGFCFVFHYVVQSLIQSYVVSFALLINVFYTQLSQTFCSSNQRVLYTAVPDI